MRIRVADAVFHGRQVLIGVHDLELDRLAETFVSRKTALKIGKAIIAAAKAPSKLDWSEEK